LILCYLGEVFLGEQKHYYLGVVLIMDSFLYGQKQLGKPGNIIHGLRVAFRIPKVAVFPQSRGWIWTKRKESTTSG